MVINITNTLYWVYWVWFGLVALCNGIALSNTVFARSDVTLNESPLSNRCHTSRWTARSSRRSTILVARTHMNEPCDSMDGIQKKSFSSLLEQVRSPLNHGLKEIVATLE